jgi:hypothetical protein
MGETAMLRVFRSTGFLIVVFVIVGGCGKKPASPEGSNSDGTPKVAQAPSVATLDQETAALLKDPSTTEALTWLNATGTPKHVIWKTWDTAEARKQVKAIYDAGATKVWAASPVKTDEAQVLAQFVIELPPDPVARKRVFAWIHTWEDQIDEDHPTKDAGQKYYEINLDQ